MKTSYFALTMLALVSLACSLSSALPSQGTEPTADVPFKPASEPTVQSSTVEAPPTAASAPVEPAPPVSQCQNPYYPVAEGATWEYQLSGTTNGTFTRTLTAVRADGFDDQDVFSAGTTRQGSWECKEGALITLTPNSGAAVTAAGVQATYTIESNSGISFPANPQPGQEWAQNIVYLGQESSNGVAIETRNVMNVSCKAVSIEKVSVPAGDFEALRIDCSTTIDIFVSGNLVFAFTSASSAWHAPGVGMVKSSGTSNMGATEIVLLGYNLP